TCGLQLPEFLRWPNHDNSWAWLGQEFWELKSTGCKGAIVMPLLSCQYLQGHRELYLAHLVLSFITMGYVWQEGEKEVPKVLPRNLAIPFGEVSEMLGLPPILVHTDFVLYLCLINRQAQEIRSPGGSKECIVAKAVNGLLQPDDKILAEALQEVTNTLQEMTKTLKKMHGKLSVGPFLCNPLVPFLFFSWKDNPVLPEGLLYEGLCEEPLAYSGGSAAQSSTLHAFDELLGIQHQKESAGFLHRMRKYMPPHHQAFIEEIRSVPRLRDHVLSSGNQDLQSTYNKCVAVLSELRTYHITLVTKYIIIAAKKAKNNISQTTSPPSFLEVVGTGGSRVLKFLKSVRDTTKEAMIQL
uniref:Indoleamine 2,3-dioxygenase 2 n=1 Tax=Laticauda laticaudata TaxID=8630 RepID=A0A8C5WZ53_LATLA